MEEILIRLTWTNLSNSLRRSIKFSPVPKPKSPMLTPVKTISFAPVFSIFLLALLFFNRVTSASSSS